MDRNYFIKSFNAKKGEKMEISKNMLKTLLVSSLLIIPLKTRPAERFSRPLMADTVHVENLYAVEDGNSIILPGTDYRYFLDIPNDKNISKRNDLKQARAQYGIVIDFYLPKPFGTTPVIHPVSELNWKKIRPEEWALINYIEYFFNEEKIFARNVTHNFRELCAIHTAIPEKIVGLAKRLEEGDFSVLSDWIAICKKNLSPSYPVMTFPLDTFETPSYNSDRYPSVPQVVCIPYRVKADEHEQLMTTQKQLALAEEQRITLEKERAQLLGEIASLQKKESRETSPTSLLPAAEQLAKKEKTFAEYAAALPQGIFETTPTQRDPVPLTTDRASKKSKAKPLTQEKTTVAECTAALAQASLRDTPMQKNSATLWTVASKKKGAEAQQVVIKEKELVHEAKLPGASAVEKSAPTVTQTQTESTQAEKSKKKKKKPAQSILTTKGKGGKFESEEDVEALLNAAFALAEKERKEQARIAEEKEMQKKAAQQQEALKEAERKRIEEERAAEEDEHLCTDLAEIMSILNAPHPDYPTKCVLQEPHKGIQCGCDRIVELAQNHLNDPSCLGIFAQRLMMGKGIKQNIRRGEMLLRQAESLYEETKDPRTDEELMEELLKQTAQAE